MNTQLSINESSGTIKVAEKGKLACQICQKKFGIFNREHVCKRCLRNVDDACAKNTEFIVNYEVERHKKHKICDLCYAESSAQKELISQLGLKFGQDSQVTAHWLNHLDIQESEKAIEKKFQECQFINEKMKTSQAYQAYNDYLTTVEKVLKDNYKENYSFMEFYHYMTQDVAEGEVFRIISTVVKAFLHLHSTNIGYNKDVYDLAVFLLMFFSPAKAWFVLCKIYTKIIPKECYPINFQKHEFKLQKDIVSWMCKIIQDQFKIQTNHIPKIKDFIEIECLDYFSSFCMQKLNIQATFFVVDYIFGSPDQYLALVKVLTCIMAHNNESIQVLGSQNPKIPRIILENTQQDDIEKHLDFEITRPVSSLVNRIENKTLNVEDKKAYELELEFTQTKSTYQGKASDQEQIQQIQKKLDTTLQQLELTSQQLRNAQQLQGQSFGQSSDSEQIQQIQKKLDTTLQQLELTSQQLREAQQQQGQSQGNSETQKQLEITLQQLELTSQQLRKSQQETQELNQRVQQLIIIQQQDNDEILKLTQENSDLKATNNRLNVEFSSPTKKSMTASQFQDTQLLQQQIQQLKLQQQTLQQKLQLQVQQSQNDNELIAKLNQENAQQKSSLNKLRLGLGIGVGSTSNSSSQDVQALQQEINQLKESHKAKLQSDRQAFQQQYDQAQDAYEELEKKFLNACMKIMLLSTKQYLNANEQMETNQVQEYNSSRKNTLGWQSEVGVLTVKLQNKEKECDRLKKNIGEIEQKYENMINKIKEEYEKISSTELNKISQKFAVEKSYFEAEINKLRQKIQQLERAQDQAEQVKLELERLVLVYNQLQQNFNELEKKYNQKCDEQDSLQKKHEQTKKDHDDHIEKVKRASNQQQFDQKLQKFLTEIELLKQMNDEEKIRLQNIIKRYVIQSLELIRVQNLNKKLYQQAKQTGADNEEQLRLLKNLDQQLQKKDIQIQNMEEEMNNYKLLASQIKGQDIEGKIAAQQRQIEELTEKIRKLLDENTQQKFDIENLKIQNNTLQSNLDFSNQKLNKITSFHELEIQQLKDDYEAVVAHTVNSCNEKIQRIEMQWKQKEGQWKEKEKQLKQTITLYEEKITMLALELKQCQETINTLEEKIAFLTSELKKQQKYIQELEQKLNDLELKNQQLQQKITQLENKLAQVIQELRIKTELVEKLEITVQELNKQIELKNIQIENLENKIAQLAMELKEKQKYINQLEIDIQQLKERIDEYLRKIAQYEERIAYYEIEMEKKRNAYIRITMLCMNGKRLQLENNRLNNQIQQLNDALRQKDQKIQQQEGKIKTLQKELEDKNNYILELEEIIRKLKLQIEQLQRELADKQRLIESLQQQIDDLNKEINRLNQLIQSMKTRSEEIDTEISILKKKYHNRIRETLKRYVLIFTELCRQKDNVAQLLEKIMNLELENQKLNEQLASIMEEISEARLQLENMAVLKSQLSKKNLDLTNTNREFDLLKAQNRKTMMRLIIVSMELERSLIQNNSLQASIQNSGRALFQSRFENEDDVQQITQTTVIKKNMFN